MKPVIGQNVWFCVKFCVAHWVICIQGNCQLMYYFNGLCLLWNLIQLDVLKVWLKLFYWDLDCYTYQIFTCVSYAEARNRYRLDVCLSVCHTLVLLLRIKKAERIVILSSPHDSPFILVLCISRSLRNSDGVTPCGAAKQRWGVKIITIFDQ